MIFLDIHCSLILRPSYKWVQLFILSIFEVIFPIPLRNNKLITILLLYYYNFNYYGVTATLLHL